MKKLLFYFVRYTTLAFPIMLLIIIGADTNYYTNRNSIIATTYSTKQYQDTQKLTPIKLKNLITQKGAASAARSITKHHNWHRIIQSVIVSNKIWIKNISNILPYTPVQFQKSLEQSLAHALLIKPKIVLQQLSSTSTTFNNIYEICSENHLSRNDKLHLARTIQAMHNPSFIYQQQSCLHSLLNTITVKRAKIS